jgi:hypothetical protein
MEAMEREQLRVLELLLSVTKVSTFLVLWAMDSVEGRFCIA